MAIADRRRFSTIDNQMNRVSEIIGDGRIDGWEVETQGFPNIIVTPGSGLIDKYYINTFGNYEFELAPNGRFYIYAQRRAGVVGVEGPKSDIGMISYTDDGPPATPGGFSITLGNESSNPYFFDIALSWTANTEVDIDHYDIERRTDTGIFELVGQVDDPTATFVDEVREDETYIYRLYAVDQSGNRSVPAEDSIPLPLSSVLPQNPQSVAMPQSEAAINVLWKRPATLPISMVQHWKITYVQLDTDNSEIDSTLTTRIVNRGLYNDRIDDLIVGQRYRVTLNTVDTKNRESTGVVMSVTPQPTPAPRDPQAIAYSMEESGSGVQVNLSWTDGDSPYDPATTYRYKIYVTVDGSSESLGIDVPIGFNEEEISLYSFDLIEYFPIPEDSLVTFRITALDEAGFESFGNYVRFTTSIFSLPLRLSNLQSEFRSDTREIYVTWDNQPDTDDVHILVVDDDTEDEYVSGVTLIDTNIGKVELYIIQDVELNHRYTISVTPINKDGVLGPTSTTVELTVLSGGLPLPEFPENIEAKTNDRQVRLTWIPSESLYTESYNLYRMEGAISFDFNDWTLLGNIPKDTLLFFDYGLTNDQIYSYYITSVDIYGRESLHLPDDAVNLNFVEAIPRREGILTEPTNVNVFLVGGIATITWESLDEEFDGFTIFRSVNNLYSWEVVGTVNRDALSYTDIELPLVDGTTFYYVVEKTADDSDIVVQSTSTQPSSSILLAVVTTTDSTFSVDVTGRRDIKDIEDPLAEYTNTFLLAHKHREIEEDDPERIDLNPELIVTDWTTVDGRIFTTNEDINGSSFILKVDGRFPSTFFTVDPIRRQIIFAEAIVEFDPDSGVVIGDTPEIELRVLGVEEVQGVLDTFRFDNLHARQVQFGTLNQEQLPSINHEGRIRETMFPDRFLLERFNNHTFVVPQTSTDTTENLGTGTTFYAITEGDGQVVEIIDWDLEDDDAIVGFREPGFSPTTLENLNPDLIFNSSRVSSNPGGFQSEKAYLFEFEFVDDDPTRWVRITSFNADNSPNPVIELNKRLRFRIYLETGYSIYLCFGIREIAATDLEPGDNGGVVGAVEWVGANSLESDGFGNTAPVGTHIVGNDEWQEIDIDLQKANVIGLEDEGGNGILPTTGLGVLEHFAFTIDPDSDNPTGPFTIRIDKIEQVDDLLVAGTSQGILISNDFGTTWETSRLTDTPIHHFFQATNNQFLWAISATEVLLSVDPAHWFATQGTTGLQYIRDIVEDSEGNIFVSTEKGVYWLEIGLITTFSTFRQTQPVNAFTTDCYAMYHNHVSSGIDQIWVSTEIGIFRTENKGVTWEDTGMDTAGLVAFQIININSTAIPILIACTRKHILRKMPNDSNFQVIANFEEQHNIFDIWKIEYFANRLYVSTGSGVYSNDLDVLKTEGISSVPFERVFNGLQTNGTLNVAFGLDAVDIGDLGSRLFIGLENKLLQANESNVVSVKSVFNNKELPSFYIDNVEETIGYIYNAFNNTVCFREPVLVNKIVSAANLPRRSFFAQQGGWSQTNPDAETFLYRNGIPTWLDFTFDNTDILGEMQILDGKLRAAAELNTYNSLYPQSQQLLDTVLSDIAQIRTGGENDAPLITDATIIQFMDDYTRFLSVITETYASANSLTMIPIARIGIPRDQRVAGNRATILEEKEDFEADDSTGINVDIVTGEFDFTSVFANATSPEDRANYSFDKFDHMQITVFNANIGSTGEMTHRELEDRMEDINTGLTSHLARVAYTDMIKLGIFLEQNNNFMFDRYNASNIQSKFYAAHTNSWYDILNSTIDYNLILKVDNLRQSRFTNVVLFLNEDPYFTEKILVGTDSNIMQFSITDGVLELEDVLEPNPAAPMYIWDIYSPDGTDIYVVAAEKSKGNGAIYLTSNFGLTWTELESINLPGQIHNFRIINGNKVVGTEDGFFYCDNDFGTWFPSDFVPSDNLLDSTGSQAAFTKSIFNVEQDTFLAAESERWFYTSGNGVEFFALAERLTQNDLTVVNKILRHKNLTWIGTDKGLYNDGNSILSDSVQFGVQTDMEDSLSASIALEINDLAAGADALYAGASNGKIYRYLDENPGTVDSAMEWKQYQVPNFGPIHKMVLYEETSTAHHLVVFSYDKVRVVNVTPESGVFG